MKTLLRVISILLVACFCPFPFARTEAFKRHKRTGQSGLRALPVSAESSKQQGGQSSLRPPVPALVEASKEQAEGQSSLRLHPGALAGTSEPEAPQPIIESVLGRNVRVHVPANFESVKLEQITGASRQSWKTVGTKDVHRVDGIVEFQIPTAVSRDSLRVTGTVAAPRGSSFMDGPSIFLADPALARRNTSMVGATGAVTLAAGSASVTTNAVANTDTATRSVSESDIWRVVGDRLYFFNSLRGLQVLDITNPDAPALLGQLRAPGVGEDMYLLDSTHVALLTRATNFLKLGLIGASPVVDGGWNEGNVTIVDVSEGKPKVLAGMSYRGWLRESRLVGTALYVVSETYETYQYGLEVTSFDLSDPAHPVKRDTLFLGSWGGVIHATDRFLFVVRYPDYGDDWWHSIIEVVDISSPVGVLQKRGQIKTAGRVNDKFKMHLDGDTFTAVSAVPRVWIWNDPDAWNDPANVSRTMVETFSLANPDFPAALGSLELGVGETVRATRFDNQRLYVVTFFSMDPLWVVDLANPAAPALLGELQVPGFSNYIEPLGDRLVAVGWVDGKTAVSLFDVSDPANPVVLSQLPLGDGDYSWSEANWDEKAFSVLPGENLIMVPYSGYDPDSGYASRVQLIDLEQNALTKRGVIDHGFAARRTTVKGDRILAISEADLVTVDFADRDHPVVTSDVEIAWRVDRVLLSGDYLLQIGGAADYLGSQQTITVSKASDPDKVLARVDLDDATVAGATVRDGLLYVAQRTSEYNPIANPFTLSVFDLSSLPDVALLSSTVCDADLGWSGWNLTALWPRPGVVVWVRQQSNYWGWGFYGGGTIAILNSGTMSVSSATTSVSSATKSVSFSGPSNYYSWWNYSDDSFELVAFDVSVPSAPVLASKLNVRTGATGDWSDPFVAGGKLYVSSMALEDLPVTDPPPVDALAAADADPVDSPASPSRLYRHFLKTVDFADPATPVISEEVSIPGRIEGVSQDGGLLYTFGPRYAPDTTPTDARALHASGFDGVAAHFVAQLDIPDSESFALNGDTVLVTATTGAPDSPSYRLQTWLLSGGGDFLPAGEIETPGLRLIGALHGLLIASGDDVQHLYDVSVPATILDLGEFVAAGWNWYDRSLLQKSDGGAGRGLWEPSGSYGIDFIEFGN